MTEPFGEPGKNEEDLSSSSEKYMCNWFLLLLQALNQGEKKKELAG